MGVSLLGIYTNFTNKPIAVIIPIIIGTISFVYFVITNYDKDKHELELSIESCKMRILNIEKIIDQEDRIKRREDSLIKNFKIILDDQIKVLETKHSNSNKPKNNFFEISLIKDIDKLIKMNEGFNDLDPSEKKTIDLYNTWRQESILVLNQIDTKYNTNFKNTFTLSTILNMNEYQVLHYNASLGLSILKSAKYRIVNNY